MIKGGIFLRFNRLLLTLAILFFSNLATGKIIYVDDDANGLNDGSSWENAYIYLQDALYDADESETPVEIHVAQGTYTPDLGNINGINWIRDTSFIIANDIILSGGFAGIDSNDPNARDIEEYLTILSGDLNHDDVDINDSNYDEWYSDLSRQDNCWHVIQCVGKNSIIDGFIISGGHADDRDHRTGTDIGDNSGGGLRNDSELTIMNCIFKQNYGYYGSGGICNFNKLNIINCKFVENISTNKGGGILNSGLCSMNISNSEFKQNISLSNGGAIYNDFHTNISINNCIFSGNYANSVGGGVYNADCTLILANCTFSGNLSDQGNSLGLDDSDIEIMNCIIWDSNDCIWLSDATTLNIKYSDVQGYWPGIGNINENPLFINQFGIDNIPGTEDDDLRLAPLSPCVDSGDPDYLADPNETDLDGKTRIVGDNIDMGAYEFQGIIYVDDDAPYDNNSIEDGTKERPFNTIQEAIDIAKDGYTILVLPGLYSKINFMGKAITVSGTEGAAVIQADLDNLENNLEQDAVTFYTGEDSNSVLKNFIIKNSGLAISLNYGSSPTIHNITFVDNQFGIAAYEDSNPDIRNCIFYNNTNGDLFGCQAWYSCFEGGTIDNSNFSENPLFVDAANGDYHLKSQGWRWNESNESWTWDEITSPCIDAGDPCSPLGDEPMSIPRDPNNLFGINKVINMGAYGGTPQASMPPLGWIPLNTDTTLPPSPNPAQWSFDGLLKEVQQKTLYFDEITQNLYMNKTDWSSEDVTNSFF